MSEEEVKELSQEEISFDKELSEEEVKELLQKALREGKLESRYLLEISEWKRPGGAFVDYGRVTALYGEVEKIPINEIYEYPYTNQQDYIVVPRTKTVILLFQYANDYQGSVESHADLYIFSSSKGWFKLELY